jgi:hypothetical protein
LATTAALRSATLQWPVGVEGDSDHARPIGPCDGYLFEVEFALSGKVGTHADAGEVPATLLLQAVKKHTTATDPNAAAQRA